ncbi:hypothetical protein DE146DRAFT_347849 [Phaeosphaeria sp. MPI-PUGE-AT-0046c]|nr:hypothetical protein DE146DRAFT_347849 [Phaeosphaeria sp. MPI-PUGE-AT-0046c]
MALKASTVSNARLMALTRVVDSAEKACEDAERLSGRFWQRYERIRERQWRDSDDEDENDDTISQDSNQYERNEEEEGFDWDERGRQISDIETRLKIEATQAYYAWLSEWDTYFKVHHSQSLMQLHAAMRSKLPIEIRNMVYYHLCKHRSTVYCGSVRHNANFQDFSTQGKIEAEWHYAAEAYSASTLDVHEPGGWLLNSEYVGCDMAREVAAVFYSVNEFWVSNVSSLAKFLNSDRSQTGFKPYEHVRGAFGVNITTTCGNGEQERAWSSTEHELAFLEDLYINLKTLALITCKQQLRVKILLYTGAPLRLTRYNGERRFYNIMETIRSPIYDLIYSDVKVEVEHMRASDHHRRSFTEGEWNHFSMNKSTWEDEKANEGRSLEWLPTGNYISREALDELDKDKLSRLLRERWNHLSPLDTY